MALLEKAAVQGHVYAMHALGSFHRKREEHQQTVKWWTKAAEAGLPIAMFHLGCCLDQVGVAAPDNPEAAVWYRRAADVGHGAAASNLSMLYHFGRGRAWQIMPATSSATIFVPRFRLVGHT